MKSIEFNEGRKAYLLPAAINIIGCVLSILMIHLMNYSLLSIALAAVLFLACQLGILIGLKPFEGIDNLKSQWLMFGLTFLVLMRTLITLAQYVFRLDQIQNYEMLGIALTVCVFYGIAVFFYIYLKSEISFERFFLVQAILFGTIFNLVFPVHEIADEPQHMRTAYKLSNKFLGISDSGTDIHMRADDYAYDLSYPAYTYDDFNQYLESISSPVKNEELVVAVDDMPWSASLEYTRRPIAFNTQLYQYIAPALGITVGRLLHLNTVSMYLMGRFFSLFFYILIMYISLKIIPVGKSLLYTIALFPMSIQLAASFSRDVFRICIAVLVVAMTLRLFYGEKMEKKKQIPFVIALIAAAGLLFPLRTYVYAVISILPLLIWFYRKKWLSDRMIRIGAVILAVLVVGFIFAKYVIFPGNIVEEPQAWSTWMDEPRYTKEYFINHPLDMIAILRNTFWVNTIWFIDTMIGSSLGWLDIPVSNVLIRILFCILFVSVFARSYETKELSRKLRFALFVLGVLSCLLMIVGITVTWTSVSFSYAEGMQGRYFLPVILPLLLSFRGKGITVSEKCDAICICSQFAVLIYVSELLMLRMF